MYEPTDSSDVAVGHRVTAEAGGAYRVAWDLRQCAMQGIETLRSIGTPEAELAKLRRGCARDERRILRRLRRGVVAYRRSLRPPRPGSGVTSRRAPRPRARRASSSSTTSGADPGGDPGGDDDPPLPPPRGPAHGVALVWFHGGARLLDAEGMGS